jgi:Xaa-Pro dipeptidase
VGKSQQFSAAEYQRRHEITRRWMADAGLQAVVIYASAYGGDHVRWLTGFPPRHDTYLIWPLHGEPTLLVQLFNHVPNAQETAVIADVRWGGPDSAETAVSILKMHNINNGQIGLVGRVPYQGFQTVTTAFPHMTWRDVSQGFAGLRLVKSSEEIAFLRQGAAFTDVAMQALFDTARPGVSEFELNAAIEAAYTAVGGQHGIHFLSSTPMNAPDSYVPRQNQSERVLQTGDVVICELSAGLGGYNGQIHRPLAIGQEPTLQYWRLYEVALAAYKAIVAVLRDGTTVKDILDAADMIEANGLTVYDDLLHGYGAGYLAPVLRTRQTAHHKQAAPEFTFRENMAIVVQPNVYDPHSGAGLQVGNLLRVTAVGCEPLQRYPMQFGVCDSGLEGAHE